MDIEDEEIIKNTVGLEYFQNIVSNLTQLLDLCLKNEYANNFNIERKIFKINNYKLFCLIPKYFAKNLPKYIFNTPTIFNCEESYYNYINKKLNVCGIYVHNEVLNETIINNILSQCNNKLYLDAKLNDVQIEDIYNCNVGRFRIKNQADILDIDEVQKLVTDSFILKVAQNFLGTNPILTQTNFWITNGNESGYQDNTHFYHQDGDDFKFLKVFIYLNDVNKNNGPHSYVRGSINNLKTPEKYAISKRVSDEFIAENYDSKDILTLCGKKGKIIFENTSGYHKGFPIINGYRFMLQLVFSSTPNFFIKNKMITVKKTKLLNYFKQKYPISSLFYKI